MMVQYHDRSDSLREAGKGSGIPEGIEFIR